MRELLHVLRRSLWPLGLLYGLANLLRNACYKLGLPVHRLSVPVVCVGNLSTGGTGKTPLVVYLVQQALAAGRRPGVLARGYGRAPGAELNDEGLLLAARFPGLPQVQDPDRVRGGQRLIQEQQVDLIILDDGFQHRRLHRDRDLVCVDARRPLAGGMLPAGNLREGPRALRRAQVVVLTRAEGLDEEALAARRQWLGRIAGNRVAGDQLQVYAASHAPQDVLAMPEAEALPLDCLRGQRFYLLCAIARPQTFSDLVLNLGGEVLQQQIRRDHHQHTAAELAAAGAKAAAAGARLLVTEKDEAKLAGMPTSRWVLRLQMQFLGKEPQPDLLSGL